MIAFVDSTASVKEARSARLEARTQPTVKETIAQAAALNGVDVSSFVVSVSYKEAQSTIDAHKLTVLESEADREAFFNALENPPKPNRRLREAFALRRELIADAD